MLVHNQFSMRPPWGRCFVLLHTVMTTWTIGKRITMTCAIMCALLFAVGGGAWTSLRAIQKQAVDLKGDVIPGMIQSGNFDTLLSRGVIALQTYVQLENPEIRAALVEDMDDYIRRSDAAVAAYERTITNEEDREVFNELIAARAAYRSIRVQFLELVNAGKKAESEAYLTGTLLPAYQAFSAASTAMQEYNFKNGDKLAVEFNERAAYTNNVIIALSAAALLIAILIAFVVIRATNKVLKNVAEQLAAGAEQTAAAAGQVSASSQSLAEGASEQAASLEETSASLEEISSMTKKNAESATEAKSLANETRVAAGTGAARMAEMKHAMDAIKESSSSIARIVKTIDEIAFQTNILALNAAVEAARAGEAGAGFAVVADEVRSLAQRSAQSAKETASKIEESVSRSEHGVQISAQVAESFDEIVSKARTVDGLVAEIASASTEQSQGIGQVTLAVSQMDKVTQSNAASAEECASASEELNAQAETMRESVRELQELVSKKQQTKNEDNSRERPVGPAHAARTYAPSAAKTSPKPSAELETVGVGADQDDNDAFFK